MENSVLSNAELLRKSAVASVMEISIYLLLFCEARVQLHVQELLVCAKDLSLQQKYMVCLSRTMVLTALAKGIKILEIRLECLCKSVNSLNQSSVNSGQAGTDLCIKDDLTHMNQRCIHCYNKRFIRIYIAEMLLYPCVKCCCKSKL